MKKGRQQAKQFITKAITRVIVAAGILAHTAVIAQLRTPPSVNISVNILPPYSPYYSDYSGINASKVLLVIQNLTSSQLKIKLDGGLKGNNGISITTYSNYTPLQPIILNPHETRQLNGLALKEIFDVNNLSVIGIDKNTLARSTRIPEGMYQFCLQAVDYNNAKNIYSASSPTGCTTFFISYPEPPVLINPMPNAQINATIPQTLVFNWTNTNQVPVGTQYTIQLAQMPDVSTDPNQVLNATSVPMLNQTVTSLSYIYSLSNLGLTPGKKYAWRVIARDPANKILFKNNGVSAASVFQYKYPSQTYAATPTAVNTLMNIIPMAHITGTLAFKYHDLTGSLKLPKNFTGLAEDVTPLANQEVQLCYGQVKVPINLKPHMVVQMVALKDIQGKPIPKEVTMTYVGADSARLSYMKTDTVASQGLPAGFNPIAPAGLASSGLGEVVATTTTSATGSFSFDFRNRLPGKIIEIYPDNTALIYCYYINIKSHHYTDPRNYVYIPAGPDESTVTVYSTAVYVNNYNLSVTINRDQEVFGNKGQAQNVSIENQTTDTADVYVLRKIIPHQPMQKAINVPKNEGDNSGLVPFVSKAPNPPPFVKLDGYEIVAKRRAATIHKDNGFRATATFNNLITDLENAEEYFLYAEYKGTSLYISPVIYSYEPQDDFPEYNPVFYINEGNATAELKPNFVSVKVKGTLKYKFSNGAAAPLANVSVSLQSLSWAVDVDNPGKKKFDYSNKYQANRVFATGTTDGNGYFELDAGLMDYYNYTIGNAGFVGISQFITVNSPYYGSPDNEYVFQPGNTYNLGELTAQVREYAFTPTITGKNVQNGTTEKLKGQQVYLCRLASTNTSAMNIPPDEGVQNGLPIKQVTDDDKNLYNVIGYGVTDASGAVTFSRLVTKDPNSSDDRYYLYAESAMNSMLNYSTKYGLDATITTKQEIKWPEYYPSQGFAFNSTLNTQPHIYTQAFTAEPLSPYIEGGVYPQSNTSTNALSGVKVDLYDVLTDYTSDQFDSDAAKYGVETAIALHAIFNMKMFLHESQTTGTDAVFHFSNPSTSGKTWSLLVYSKAGFITGHTDINAGKPMTAGVKQTVKGFLLPPQHVHVRVIDADSGIPVSANIVVGTQFSWGSQTAFPGPGNQPPTTTGADLISPFGKVAFTVIPEDLIKYHTQVFSVPVVQSNSNITLPDFKMVPAKNRMNICIQDAVTHQPIAGYLTLLDVPYSQNPIPNGYNVPKGSCHVIEFESNLHYYHVKVTADGYATTTVMVPNNSTIGYAQGIDVQMQPGMNIAGTVKVNGKAVANAKVYIQELTDVPEAFTDAAGNYKISGVPRTNQQVVVVATKSDMNAPGQEKRINLNLTVEQDAINNPAPPSNTNGYTITNGNNNVLGPISNGNGNMAMSQQSIALAQSIATATKTKMVNFSLVTNNDYNLSELYGFKLDVESMQTASGNVVYLTGKIKIPDNQAFQMKTDGYLHFTNIKIKPGTNHAAIVPVTSLVPVDNDDVDISVFGIYTGQLRGFYTGIEVSPGGGIGGTPVLTGGNIFGGVKLLNEVTLSASANLPKPGLVNTSALNGTSSVYKAVENQGYVFTSDKSPEKNQITPYYTFSCSNGIGAPYQGLRYRLNNTYFVDANGYVASDGFHLNSIAHTALQNVNKPDLAINLGEVKADYKAMQPIKGPAPIVIPIDDWTINANNWFVMSGPLTMAGNISAGSITVPFTGVEMNEIGIGFGNMQVNQIGIAGVYKLDINQSQTLTSFGYDKAAAYGTINNKHYGCWSLSLLPNDPNGVLTHLANLPDLAVGNTINIMNISLYSKGGSSLIQLQQNHPLVTLNGFASFQPYEIENGADYLSINGALNFNIEGFTGTSNAPYSLNYTASNGVLIHKHEPIAGLKLTTNGIHADFLTTGQQFNNGVLKLEGNIQDKAGSAPVNSNNPQANTSGSPYNFLVTFNKQGNTAKLRVDSLQNDKNVMQLGTDQQMHNIRGGMALTDGQPWSYFNFNGDVSAAGMPATNPTHISFNVKGDLVASQAKIGIENMSVPALGNMSMTYDFGKKAIVGSMHLNNISTPIASATADLEMMLGNGSWYILGAATINNLSLPLPVDGAGAAFLVGNTDITDDMYQVIQPVFHNSELPPKFKQSFGHVRGSLFVAGVEMKLPILPDIDFNAVVADVHLHYGVYANAYFGVSFNSKGVNDAQLIGGGRVGAYVNIGAGASLGLVCAGISLAADLQGDVGITFNHADFTNLNPVSFLNNTEMTLIMSAQATLSGQAYIGGGICNSSCGSVKVWGVTVPPGCFKKSISADFGISGGMTLYKASQSTKISVSATAKLFSNTYTTPTIKL